MSRELANYLAGSHVPNARDCVETSRGELFAVRKEGHALLRTDLSGHGLGQRATFSIPNTYGPVRTCCQQMTVRTICQTLDRTGISRNGTQGVPGPRIP